MKSYEKEYIRYVRQRVKESISVEEILGHLMIMLETLEDGINGEYLNEGS